MPLWAAEHGTPGITIVSDSRYVVDGVVSLLAGHGKHLLDGPDADLWSRMAQCRPRTRWTPSHRTLQQARDQGLNLGSTVYHDFEHNIRDANPDIGAFEAF